jgi:hypothetical protein
VKKVNRDVKAANVKLTAELESYKENVKAFEFHNKRVSELETGYQNSVSREKQLQLKFDTLDVNSFKKIKALNAEISDLQNQLSKQKTAYTNLEKERDELKKDFAKKEDKLLAEIVESEHMIAHLEELVVKSGQSSQTMKMISNQTNPIYHTKHKMALGNNTPSNLKKAQQEQNVLYNGNVIYTKHDPPIVRDSVQTIEHVEESINKMKQKDLKPIDYNKLNKLSGITFVTQKEPSVFSIKRPFSKMFSKKVIASKSLSKIEQMSSNNTFNTSEARDILNDVKKRIQELQNIVASKTTININNWHSSFHIEQKKVFENDITIPLNNISARVIHFEQAFLKEMADFVKDHKSLVNEANDTRENMNVLENLNDYLFEAVMTTDIMSIILQTYSVQDDERLRAETSAIVSKYENALIKLEKENVSYFKQLDRKKEECKYEKLSYERALKNMKEQNDLLRAQLESQKGKGEETKFAKPSTSEKPNVSNTVQKPKMSISRFAPKVDEKKNLTKPVTPTPLPKKSENEKIVDKGKAVVETPKVLAPGLFRISPTNTSASTSKTNACKKDNSKESSDAKKDNNINPNACALPSTGLESTSRSSRLKPRSNTRNNRVSSASTSSSKNKVEEVEEHPRNLSLCNKKHDSSECNVESTGSNACNDSVCLICKKCLINDVHDECVSKNVNVTPEQKYVPKGTSARSRYIERLVERFRSTTSSRMPGNYLKFCMWIPTGREFTLQNGKLEVAQNKHVATFDVCDSEFTPNPMEPNLKRFPNTNSSVLGRLSKYVFGSSTRVAPST